MANNTRRRERIVSFRVSEAEYESLRAASETDGANSISEYARRAACTKPPAPETPEMRALLQNLYSRVDELQNEMQRLSTRLDQMSLNQQLSRIE